MQISKRNEYKITFYERPLLDDHCAHCIEDNTIWLLLRFFAFHRFSLSFSSVSVCASFSFSVFVFFSIFPRNVPFVYSSSWKYSNISWYVLGALLRTCWEKVYGVTKKNNRHFYVRCMSMTSECFEVLLSGFIYALFPIVIQIGVFRHGIYKGKKR